jgi:hypothetical protein
VLRLLRIFLRLLFSHLGFLSGARSLLKAKKVSHLGPSFIFCPTVTARIDAARIAAAAVAAVVAASRSQLCQVLAHATDGLEGMVVGSASLFPKDVVLCGKTSVVFSFALFPVSVRECLAAEATLKVWCAILLCDIVLSILHDGEA